MLIHLCFTVRRVIKFEYYVKVARFEFFRIFDASLLRQNCWFPQYYTHYRQPREPFLKVIMNVYCFVLLPRGLFCKVWENRIQIVNATRDAYMLSFWSFSTLTMVHRPNNTFLMAL